MITEEEENLIKSYMNNSITNVTDIEMDMIKKYKKSLKEDELIAMCIAIKVLESSFDIKKSQGYLIWKEKNCK